MDIRLCIYRPIPGSFENVVNRLLKDVKETGWQINDTDDRITDQVISKAPIGDTAETKLSIGVKTRTNITFMEDMKIINLHKN